MNSLPALVVAVAAALACLVLAVVRAKYLLHMLQLEEYDSHRFVHWVLGHLTRLYGNYPLDALALIGLLVLVVRPDHLAVVILTDVAVLTLGAWGLLRERQSMKGPVKKALVMTPRAWRLLICCAAVSVAVSAVSFIISPRTVLVGSLLLPAGAPLVMLASRFLMEPLEAAVRRWYLRDAHRKLVRLQPIVVGITGSYGKTSTKFFLTHLLESRYRVLMTPESYNTAMGICRVIRGQLGPEHEVFVVELAENEKGGFRHLLSLVPCSMSIVTSVGVQHLEEFGSEAAIHRVMREFVSMERSGPTVVLNGDDPILGDMIDVAGKKLLRTSTNGSRAADLRADSVSVSCEGLTFDIVTSQGERVPCHSTVLGRHNVQNILLAVAAARELGVSWVAVQEGILTLQAPPHRLQMLSGAAGVHIIDDAFNSNPAGFAMAMEVLASFPSRRVLVTPGLVSLGSAEEAENVEAGKRAATAADTVILVGPRKTQPVRAGLLTAGFPETSIVTVHSLDEVTSVMRSLLAPGDTVLFENDLPDTYNE
jgi:UDP-N-acetylmuramoyl-tripeptide--D-alanyl-D-alanine ligase